MTPACGCDLIDSASPELAFTLLQHAILYAPPPDPDVTDTRRPHDVHRVVLCPHLRHSPTTGGDFDPRPAVRCRDHHDCSRRRRWLEQIAHRHVDDDPSGGDVEWYSLWIDAQHLAEQPTAYITATMNSWLLITAASR